jgi:hypothetical protein
MERSCRNNEPEVQVETLFQFPKNGSWVDNIALRSDGSLLLTRLDVPEVWSVNTTSGNATLAYSFPNATSCFGISEIDSDVFAVVVGNFSTETYRPQDHFQFKSWISTELIRRRMNGSLTLRPPRLLLRSQRHRH